MIHTLFSASSLTSIRIGFVGLLVFLLLATPVGLDQFVAAQDQPSKVWVGTAKVDVTPTHPVVLAGYGGRTSEFDGVDTKLWARALVIGKDRPVAIVVIDNCGVPTKLVEQIKKKLQPIGFESDRVVISATHTHNAPNLVGYAPILWAGRTNEKQAENMGRYTEFAIDKMVESVRLAKKTMTQMELLWKQGRVRFGGNRRVLHPTEGGQKWGGFGFQRTGPVDHSLPVMFGRDSTGKVRMVWASYACHCTTSGSVNRVNGDWAGFANQVIEQKFPGAVSLVSIGCGADVGPQPSGNLTLALDHGKSIAAEVQRLAADKQTPAKVLSAPDVKQSTAKLPLEKPAPRSYWDQKMRATGFEHQLAKAMLGQLDRNGAIESTVDYPVTSWSFGDRLVMVFLPGEVVVDYSVRLNKELDWRRLAIVAWSNGMPGYIPSKRVLKEGGYEADFSQIYYGHPSRYRAEVEEEVVATVKKVVPKKFFAAVDQKPAPFHVQPSLQKQTFAKLKREFADASVKERKGLESILALAASSQPGVQSDTIQSGEKTEWYNFAGDFADRRFIRQEKTEAVLKWRTPKLKRQERQVIGFMGGVGWISQPESEGFSLKIGDGQPVVFEVTLKRATWKSNDNQIQVDYFPTWKSDVDSAGFFFVSFPGRLVGDDQAAEITVRSLSSGSKRWFSIDTRQEYEVNKKLLQTSIGKIEK